MVDRIPHDAPVLVIGLGRFGAATAGQLTRLDREVLAIDEDMNLVQKWSERVTHAVQADARSIDALRQVGAQDFAIAIVASRSRSRSTTAGLTTTSSSAVSSSNDRNRMPLAVAGRWRTTTKPATCTLLPAGARFTWPQVSTPSARSAAR